MVAGDTAREVLSELRRAARREREPQEPKIIEGEVKA